MGAKKLVPMHYGTYDLSDEPLSDPVESLRQAHQESGSGVQLCIPAPGEPVWF
jgi:L-ascorbate metabolism protein UlaG (beta-lactamase superfamily)